MDSKGGRSLSWALGTMTACVLSACLAFPVTADARGGRGGGHSGGGRSSSHVTGSHATRSAGIRAPRSSTTHIPHSSSRAASTAITAPRANTAVGAQRDKHGRIARSTKAKDEFKKTHPCPSTGKSSGSCPGYVIDHVQPLKRGGADRPSNMQWQTKEAAKEKDRAE